MKCKIIWNQATTLEFVYKLYIFWFPCFPKHKGIENKSLLLGNHLVYNSIDLQKTLPHANYAFTRYFYLSRMESVHGNPHKMIDTLGRRGSLEEYQET